MKVAHQAEKEDYESQLTELRSDYTKTKEELGGENMVLTKKLDSLEEFRQQREQLMTKFEKLNTDFKEQKDMYEKKIYDLEKSHIKEQDRLKKEMMERVENVAAEFRKASHAQMAATTQRTIRENVNISSQLQQLTEKATSLTTENDKLTLKESDSKAKISLLETELDKLARKNAYRQKVILELSQKCRTQELRVEELKGFDQERRKFEVKIEKLSKEIQSLESSLTEKNVAAKDKEQAIKETKLSMLQVSKDKAWLDTCLRDACMSIQKCLALLGKQEDSQEVEEVEKKAHREDVLNQLLLLLNTAINRNEKDREKEERTGPGRRSSARERSAGREKSAGKEKRQLDVVLDEEGERDEDNMNYQAGALGLVPR